MRAHPALVLNADFQPLNYFPLSTMDWQTAVKNIYEGNLSVVAEYDEVVRGPSKTMRLPSVVAMRDFMPIPKRMRSTFSSVGESVLNTTAAPSRTSESSTEAVSEPLE